MAQAKNDFMDTTRTLIIGLKGQAIAFDKETGRELWRAKLKPGTIGGEFVSLLMDGERVFAHCGGSLYCLDATNGRTLWSNDLPGLGYGLATIAVVGATSPSAEAIRHRQQQEQAAGAAAASGGAAAS